MLSLTTFAIRHRRRNATGRERWSHIGMNKWMLDTNAVRALVDGDSPRLDGLFGEQRCCISAIVAAEIRYGLEKNALNARKRQLVESALARLEVLPWTDACAVVYGRLRAV